MANVYECMFIFDSNRYAKDPSGVPAKIPEMLETIGGELLASRLWLEQRLAYPINGQRKGTYWLTYFRSDSSKLVEFNRACQLNDNILRHLILKVDEQLAETLVAHAKGESQPEAEPAEAAPEVQEEVVAGSEASE